MRDARMAPEDILDTDTSCKAPVYKTHHACTGSTQMSGNYPKWKDRK